MRLYIIKFKGDKLRILRTGSSGKIKIDIDPLDVSCGVLLEFSLKSGIDGSQSLLSVKNIVNWVFLLRLWQSERTKITIVGKLLFGSPEKYGTYRIPFKDAVHEKLNTVRLPNKISLESRNSNFPVSNSLEQLSNCDGRNCHVISFLYVKRSALSGYEHEGYKYKVSIVRTQRLLVITQMGEIQNKMSATKAPISRLGDLNSQAQIACPKRPTPSSIFATSAVANERRNVA